MALSQTPPPLFHQGLSARIRLIVAVAAAAALMQLDFHLGFAQPLRQGINAVLYPISELLMLPRDMAISSAQHMTSIRGLREKVAQMEQREIEQVQTLLSIQQLQSENDNLRNLMGLVKPLSRSSVVAEIRSARPSPLHDLVVINRGLEHGITKGDPVLSGEGGDRASQSGLSHEFRGSAALRQTVVRTGFLAPSGRACPDPRCGRRRLL